MGITEKIKKRAYEIGFDLIGICDPKPFYNAYNILKERKDNNKLPAFISHDLNLLSNPGKHFKNLNSIISVGLSYISNTESKAAGGRIALYARGKDYHLILQEKMNILISYIKEITKDTEAKPFVDTVPLLEKEIARKSGLGWIGKNNLLINPVYGSFIVLGEILTDLNLKVDEPITNKCGDCNICINRCPTGALKEAYYLDSALCISYLTQKKGYLTEEERKMLGNNIWGCDICQLNCPYNKNIAKSENSEFKPVLETDLIKIVEFENFPDKWKYSAISWRGLETIKRNVIINMALSGDRKYLNYLQKEFQTKSPLIDKYRNWAIKVLRSGNKDA